MVKKPVTVKTTIGIEFILAKDIMSSMHLCKETDGNERHWAYRKDIQAAFRNGAQVPTGGDYLRGANVYEYWGINKGFEVHKNSVSIIIGCMRFSGVQFKRLRKWATGK